MFLIAFWRWLKGWVRLEAEGGFPERLLNLAARSELQLWNTVRKGAALSACCFARDYHRLRPLMRKTGMRMRLRERHGVPFFLRRYRARWGIAAGLALYIVLLQVMAGRIWVIRVNGLDHADETAILSTMEEAGVRIGGKRDALDLTTIQLTALRELKDISWLAVNLDGSIANIDITEWDKNAVQPESTAPSNIKARRDGLIVKVEAAGGQAMVQPGDAVTEGSLLISGIVDSGEGPLLRRSEGHVFAQTQHKLEARIPLTQLQQLPDGRQIVQPTLQLFNLFIPLYTNGEITQNTLCEEANCPLTVRGVPLPIGLHLKRYTFLSEQTVTYTETEAAALAAKEIAEKEIVELENVEIKNRTEETRLEDGCYILIVRYDCVEDIAVEEPLLLSDH